MPSVKSHPRGRHTPVPAREEEAAGELDERAGQQQTTWAPSTKSHPPRIHLRVPTREGQGRRQTRGEDRPGAEDVGPSRGRLGRTQQETTGRETTGHDAATEESQGERAGPQSPGSLEDPPQRSETEGGQKQETLPRSQPHVHPACKGNWNGTEGLPQRRGESEGEQDEQGNDPQGP